MLIYCVALAFRHSGVLFVQPHSSRLARLVYEPLAPSAFMTLINLSVDEKKI